MFPLKFIQFARGFCVWVPRLTGRYRLWALLGSKKFYKMQARVLHRVHMARGLSQAVSCLILFPCVASEICELFILAMVCANFIDYGAVFDIKVVGLLVPAVDYQASV